MARKPVSVFKRPLSKKGRFSYYIKIWDGSVGSYSVPRSALSIFQELELDPAKYSPTSRTGAFLIGEELRKRGGYQWRKSSPLLADYCAHFWDWEKSEYVQGKLARGQRIGKTYCDNMYGYVVRHVKPRVGGLRLHETTARHLDGLQLRIKKETALGACAINAIMDAIALPVREAFRLGIIGNNPSQGLRSLSDDTREKGIPTSSEMEKLFSSSWDDERNRLAVKVAYTAGARLGEVLALRADDIALDFEEKPVLWIRASWSVKEGRKSTKTGNIRVVPIDDQLRDDLLSLVKKSPHGTSLIFWDDLDPEVPISHKKIEGAFYRQLRKIKINEDDRKRRNITFHSLRHAFNSALRGTVSDPTLKLVTGHATDAMTNHYDHLTDERLAEIRKAQEERIVQFRKVSGGEK